MQLRLADGFVAGVEERRGFGAVLCAKTFSFACLGFVDVEDSAFIPAVESEWNCVLWWAQQALNL